MNSTAFFKIIITILSSFQLIFRKVSDVLKEQELAERRKNEPVLNNSQDHLVRKLFSRFKKGDGVPSGGGTSLVGPGGGSGAIVATNRLEKDLGGEPSQIYEAKFLLTKI